MTCRKNTKFTTEREKNMEKTNIGESGVEEMKEKRGRTSRSEGGVKGKEGVAGREE